MFFNKSKLSKVSPSKRGGFTLIELLVVISIIGMLSSVVLVSVSTARAKGRDATRVQTLSQIRNALELYYADNLEYPVPNNGNKIEDIVEQFLVPGGYTTGLTNSFETSGVDSWYISDDGSSYEMIIATESGGSFARNVNCSDSNISEFENNNTPFIGKVYCLGNVGGTGTSIGGVTVDLYSIDIGGEIGVGWTSTNATGCELSFNPNDPYYGHETSAVSGSFVPTWVIEGFDYLDSGVGVGISCSSIQGEASDSIFLSH